MVRLLLLLLAQGAWSQTLGPADSVVEIPFSGDCGLITRYAPTRIPPSCLQDALNIHLDESLTLERRSGHAQANSTGCTGLRSVRGLWPFRATDGTNYLIILSSETLFQTTNGTDCTVTSPRISGLSLTVESRAIQTLGTFWLTNATNGLISYVPGVSSAAVSGAPSCDYIGAFRNRVVLAGCTGALTRVRLSGELDGTAWTVLVPGVSTTPANIDISGTHDGCGVSCLLGEYQNSFLIGRDCGLGQGDLYGLYGYDRRNFQLHRINREIGCMEAGSVGEKNNALHWLSRRGLEKMSGTTISRASDAIRPTIDEIITSAGNSRTLTLTTQADFEGGSANSTASGPGAPVSTSRIPASVVTSSWTRTDTSGSDFGDNGTRVNVSTISVSGDLTLIQASSAAFINAGGESNSTTNWDIFEGSWQNTATGPAYGSRQWRNSAGGASSSLAFRILDSSNQILLSRCDAITDGMAHTTFIVNTTTLTNTTVKIECGYYNLATDCSGSSERMRSTAFIRGTEVVYSIGDFLSGASVQPMFDIPETNIITSGTFVSQHFDTDYTTPTWGNFSASVSSPSGSALTFEVAAASSTNGAFETYVSQSLGANSGAARREFIRYRGTFSVNAATETPPQMQDATLVARTTAYYISDCAAPASTISSWGRLRTNTAPAGGSFNFWTSTSTVSCADAAGAANARWVSQAANTTITNATSTFISARTEFLLGDDGDNDPSLTDLTFEWNEGSDRPPVASAVYRDRYHLFYTTFTASGAANNRALVLDSNDKWTLYDNINAYSAAVYNNNLYTGDSGNTGLYFEQDTGFADRAGNYTSRFKTAELDFGEPRKKKILKTVYVAVDSEGEAANNISMSMSYYIDGSTTAVSLGSVNLDEAPEPGGFFNAKLPAPSDQNRTFNWLALEGTYTGQEGPLRVHSIAVHFEVLDFD